MRASKAFNLAQFAKIEARHESDFDDFGTVVSIGKGEGSTYTYRDNGSNVLLHISIPCKSEATLHNKRKAFFVPRLEIARLHNHTLVA